jgi:hypothetical protein
MLVDRAKLHWRCFWHAIGLAFDRVEDIFLVMFPARAAVAVAIVVGLAMNLAPQSEDVLIQMAEDRAWRDWLIFGFAVWGLAFTIFYCARFMLGLVQPSHPNAARRERLE